MKKCQREDYCRNFLVVTVRKMMIQTLEKEKLFSDTHLMKNQSSSDDKDNLKKYQIVWKNLIIDGVNQVKYL